MYNRKFCKKYLILDCETRGFGLWGKIPQGTASMEIKSGKGWISLVIQGLLPKEDGDYTLYFVFHDAKGYRGAKAGSVPVSSGGSAKLKFAFDPNDVLGTGFKAEDIKIAAVMAGNGDSEPVAPLCGYFNERVDWRKNFSYINPRKEVVAVSKTESANGVSKKIFPLAEEKVSDLTENNIMPEKSVENEIFLKEVERLKDSAENADSGGENLPLDGEAELIWNFSEKINPFSEEMPVEWAKINIRQTSCLPLKSQKSVNDSKVLLNYKKYGYFILGKLSEDSEKVILLGVPGTYSKKNEVDFNRVGFYYFKPAENIEKEDGVEGYWLLSIE